MESMTGLTWVDWLIVVSGCSFLLGVHLFVRAWSRIP